MLDMVHTSNPSTHMAERQTSRDRGQPGIQKTKNSNEDIAHDLTSRTSVLRSKYFNKL